MILITTVSSATNYYVCDCATGSDPNCIVGDDNNAGTSMNAPWQTTGKVSAVVNGLQAGDQILFAKGGAWVDATIGNIGNNPVEKAEYFIQHNLTGFGIPADELELMTVTTNDHFNQVFFTQRHEGNEVLFSRLSVKLTLDGKVVGFGADVFSHISLEQATLSAAEAAAEAMVGLTDNIESVDANSDVKILPVPDYTRKQSTYRLVYEVTVHTMDEDGIPSIYLTYVDAVDGTIYMRQNLVCHSESEPPGSASVTVTDDLSLTQPYDPETNSVLRTT